MMWIYFDFDFVYKLKKIEESEGKLRKMLQNNAIWNNFMHVHVLFMHV